MTRFLRESMLQDGIKASFALGGITKAMVDLLQEGLVEKIIDVKILIILLLVHWEKTDIIMRLMPICTRLL